MSSALVPLLTLSRHAPRRASRHARSLSRGTVATFLAACLAACSDDPPDASTNTGESASPTSMTASTSDPSRGAPGSMQVPDQLEPIEDPADRLKDMEVVEELTETLANQLITWGDLLRRRQFADARDLLTEDFLGHDPGQPGTPTTRDYDLGVSKTTWDVGAPVVVHRDTFLEGMRDFLSPFATIEWVLPKLKGAEFTRGKPAWASLNIQLSAYGRLPEGGRLARTGWVRGKAEEKNGQWRVTRWTLTSLDDLRRARPLFTEIGRPAGVAHKGPRFGKDGNDSFFWNGAAVGDFDGDGRYDLFVPSDEANFLYHNQGDGTFVNVAEQAGVAQPPDGTGALFFDYDNDGDQDLMVGRVGFQERGDTVGGPCQLYRNDGEGQFENVSTAAGLTDMLVAFSLAAADVNDDGFLDVYVCGYNTEGFTAPNSWHAANNGTPNALYINQGDGTFVNRAPELGVDDARWSYAAAFADFDQDGDQDLYVANDYAENSLFVNQGDGHFVDAARELGVTDVGNGMGAQWGDFDQDGALDLYVSNMSSSAGTRILKRLTANQQAGELEQTLFKLAAGNTLFRWTGDGFERMPGSFGGTGASWAWAAQFADLELDGDLDLLCVNGFLSGDSGGAFKDT